VSVRGIAGNSQLHLSADHFSKKVDLVRLTQLAHCQIHLVDKLRIRRQKRHGLPACPKAERQKTDSNKSRQYRTLHLFVLPFDNIAQS